jgi:predicted nucleic acid-binding protein
MARWYFDTSVLVAAAVQQHPHNSRAMIAIEALIDGKHRGYMSTHSLTEVYSVLTRTPFQPPVHPTEALKAIENQILSSMALISLDESEYIEVVRRAAGLGWIGGRIHDVIHLKCALKMKCDRIYTFNLRDFRAIAPTELADKIVAP